MVRDRGRGRPFDTRLGEDLAVLCALSRAGAAASPHDIAELLVVSQGRATEILRCLSSDSGCGSPDDTSSGPMLALYATGSDGSMARVSTLGATPVPALRITEPQAQAVAHALDQLGIGEGDERRAAIERAFFPVDANGEPRHITSQQPVAPATEEDDPCPLGTLEVCARSIVAAKVSTQDEGLVVQPVVTFSYRGENDLIARTRMVVPRSIVLREGYWLVEAHDLDARAARTFLASKMQDARLLDELRPAPRHMSEQPSGGTVRLTCTPRAAAKVRLWSGARVVTQLGDGRVEIDVPYFRGDWLPRHVLALGKDVSHGSYQLHTEMRAIAREDLRRAKRVWAKGQRDEQDDSPSPQ